jgi:hypothetical protein
MFAAASVVESSCKESRTGPELRFDGGGPSTCSMAAEDREADGGSWGREGKRGESLGLASSLSQGLVEAGWMGRMRCVSVSVISQCSGRR